MSINNTGANALTYIFTLIKNRYVAKVFKTGSSSVYKTLSDNDLTDTLKTHYDLAYTHSQIGHAPYNAEQNVLESVKVNNIPLTVRDKAVNLVLPDVALSGSYNDLLDLPVVPGVPQNVSAFNNDAGYQTASDVAAAIAGIASFSIQILGVGEYDANRKPTVTGAANKLYLVPLADAETNNAYAEWLYVNNAWEYVGQMEVNLAGYVKSTDIVELTNTQIQTIWDNVLSA